MSLIACSWLTSNLRNLYLLRQKSPEWIRMSPSGTLSTISPWWRWVSEIWTILTHVAPVDFSPISWKIVSMATSSNYISADLVVERENLWWTINTKHVFIVCFFFVYGVNISIWFIYIETCLSSIIFTEYTHNNIPIICIRSMRHRFTFIKSIFLIKNWFLYKKKSINILSQKILIQK